MPGSYSAGAPSVSGDTLAVNRFLADPVALQRRLRSYRDLRFVSDQLLTSRFNSRGGAVLYETGEAFQTDRGPESVAPGSEYPYANLPLPTAAVAVVQKWGEKVFLSDEEISRNRFPGTAVDRAMRKVVNTIIAHVDGITMSLINSQVTATFSVTGGGGLAWTASGATLLRDVLRAKAQIVGLDMGYVPDTLAVDDTQYAYLMSDEKVTNALSRETTTNPVYTGEIQRIAGLTIVVSPKITTPVVLDSTQLGGMADETDGSPGYAVSDLAVQVRPIRLDTRDGWDLQARRKTVPIVQEPGAAVKLTNTGV